MPSPSATALVWFRRDLRVHDHPALHTALAEYERVVPVFVLDRALVAGRYASPARTAFMLACLRELRGALKERGSGLVLREGDAADELVALAEETGASAVLWASDVGPYAMARDQRVREALADAGVDARPQPGNFCADVSKPRTGQGRPYVVFTPFWKAHQRLERRAVHGAPRKMPALPSSLATGTIPSLENLGLEDDVPEPVTEAGEAAARRALTAWLAGPIERYDERHDDLTGGTSVLSPHVRWGTLSVREMEERAAARGGAGADAYCRQLAWRDFYAHVLLLHPGNTQQAFQARYRELRWADDADGFEAWKAGRTGFPLVDAAMRQLDRTGWMHNRARMVVGSFLTKDLHLDWRDGERWFAHKLLDGEPLQNNGNWQWVASTGVDPAPYFRRMFNPTTQAQKFDPDGTYIRRWVPELANVSDRRIHEPWRMSDDEQAAAGCVIGEDYPAPIVDHKAERLHAMERYRAVADA
ncbi:DNA photolyase family protein [Paraconexibacter antarcticus]|uniref:DNA photolyase family protein n=1 Tax=Paraconexibacter antarcticus TaxID=2949664 RepID=A0ABY5E0U6_9ACTN|nr:deoxyribodipyrimidine photo-lyase [Paraconexibacter antarcticus]UTI66477.1 DNA photolyase family protein [Paraconexibacter antarcticus]